MDRPEQTTADRAVSEVVGVVILFGLVMTGVGLLVVTGGHLTGAISENSRMQAATSDMQRLDAGFGTLSKSHGSATVSFRDDGSSTTLRQTDTLRLAVDGNVACSATVPLDAVVKRVNGVGTVVYQAGGVWKTTGGDATMISPPSIRYHSGAVDLSVVTLRGDPGNDMVATVDEAKSTRATRAAKANLFDRPSCRRPDSLTLTVTSERYDDAWYQYLSQEMPDGATVTHDPANGRVSVSIPQAFLAERADDDRNRVVDFRTNDATGAIRDVNGDGEDEILVDKPDDANEYAATTTVLGSYVSHVESETTHRPVYDTRRVRAAQYGTQRIPMKLWIDPDDVGSPHPITNPWHYVLKYDRAIEGFEPPVYIVLFADNVHQVATWGVPPPHPTTRGRDAFRIVQRPNKDDKIIFNSATATRHNEPTNDDLLLYKAGCDVSHVRFIGEEAGYHNEILIGDRPNRVVVDDDEDVREDDPHRPGSHGQLITLPGGDKCTNGSEFYYDKKNFQGYDTVTERYVDHYQSVTKYRLVRQPVDLTVSTPDETRSVVPGSTPVDRAVNYQSGTPTAGLTVDDGDPVALDATVHSCRKPQYETVRSLSHAGTTYNLTRCAGVNGAGDPTGVRYFTDGDPVPSSGSRWYQKSLSEVVSSEYTDGSGHFDLDSNQVVVVFRYDDGGTTDYNNVVVLYEMGSATSEVTADWIVDLQITSVDVAER